MLRTVRVEELGTVAVNAASTPGRFTIAASATATTATAAPGWRACRVFAWSTVPVLAREAPDLSAQGHFPRH
ncbi:hypothetical protein NUM3379_18890 [Kineococcus sp. NUM-3379]